MCGITGYWAQRSEPDLWACDLARSVETLRLRGPDDSGVWVSSERDVGLGHTRLSILDLSDLGHQPMVSEDGDFVMVFNGEIYNFAQIRSELQARGHRFRSSGDSEVVLSALREWGPAAVERFIGMFAIALWCRSQRRLWLIRDRLGVKPLYYAWNGRVFWFGSELKALRGFGAWRAEIDRNAVGDYFQYGYIAAPRSIYRHVYKLQPGHWLELGDAGEPVSRCYWSAAEPREPFAASEDELAERLEALCIDAFRYRMVADVPVGVFLSGGLDSTLVAAILSRHSGQQIHTFTIGFQDPDYDESSQAREIAGWLGTCHSERILSPDQMLAILAHWGTLFDEPFGDPSGVPTFLVSRVARESVKVALSADGGDELFSGYHHYGVMLQRERLLARIPAALRHALSHTLQSLPDGSLQRLVDLLPAPASMKHAARRSVVERIARLRSIPPDLNSSRLYELGLSLWTPEESERLLGGPYLRRPLLNGYARCLADHMSHSDIRYYLPDDILTKVDRTTMAVGLEGREPLLDHRLVEFALRLPLHLRRGSLGTKHLLRRVLYRYVPRTMMERPKRGFAVPMSRWLRAGLSDMLDTYLAPDRIREAGICDPRMVRHAVQCFRDAGARRDRLDVQRVWLLAAFEMWREKWA